MLGYTSLDGTTVEEVQVQTSEWKEIHSKKIDEIVSSTPLSAVELSYQAIQMSSIDLDQNPSPKEEYDPYISPI